MVKYRHLSSRALSGDLREFIYVGNANCYDLNDTNDSVSEPEMRWYISPAVVVDLVGGRPSDVKEYLLTRKAELDAHHNKFEQKITPGYNRRPLPITQRIHMEDVPAGVATESWEEETVVEE